MSALTYVLVAVAVPATAAAVSFYLLLRRERAAHTEARVKLDQSEKSLRKLFEHSQGSHVLVLAYQYYLQMAKHRQNDELMRHALTLAQMQVEDTVERVMTRDRH